MRVGVFVSAGHGVESFSGKGSGGRPPGRGAPAGHRETWRREARAIGPARSAVWGRSRGYGDRRAVDAARPVTGVRGPAQSDAGWSRRGRVGSMRECRSDPVPHAGHAPTGRGKSVRSPRRCQGCDERQGSAGRMAAPSPDAGNMTARCPDISARMLRRSGANRSVSGQGVPKNVRRFSGFGLPVLVMHSNRTVIVRVCTTRLAMTRSCWYMPARC